MIIKSYSDAQGGLKVESITVLVRSSERYGLDIRTTRAQKMSAGESHKSVRMSEIIRLILIVF